VSRAKSQSYLTYILSHSDHLVSSSHEGTRTTGKKKSGSFKQANRLRGSSNGVVPQKSLIHKSVLNNSVTSLQGPSMISRVHNPDFTNSIGEVAAFKTVNPHWTSSIPRTNNFMGDTLEGHHKHSLSDTHGGEGISPQNADIRDELDYGKELLEDDPVLVFLNDPPNRSKAPPEVLVP